ncbi:MAG: hypothetical protein QW435_03415 [Candidatus Hadarchaeales archaeon]
MPTLSVNLEDFYSLLGERREGKELCENLALMGVEAELSGEELRMEILHNRPDLLSPEGVARALKGFLGRERGLPSYRLSRSGIVVKVDRSVGKVSRRGGEGSEAHRKGAGLPHADPGEAP